VTAPLWGRYDSIHQIKEANKGGYWFHDVNMRYFGTSIESSVIGGCLFVTRDYAGFDRKKKVYKVRYAGANGFIGTAGRDTYTSLRKAIKVAEGMADKRQFAGMES